jgi:hypothetical protein
MIFTGFKRKTNQLFIKNHINDFLKKETENRQPKIKNVLVFVDDVSEIGDIKKEIFQELKIEENQLEIVVYQQKTVKNIVDCLIISPENFGWYGKLKQEKFPFSLTKKYDLLINYSKVDHFYLNLLSLQMKISFKIGFSHFDNRFYNFLVNCDSDNITIFTNEIKKYLTILNKL